MEVIENLVEETENRWRGCGYREASLPKIACEVFEQVQPHRHLGVTQIVETVLRENRFPAHPARGVVTLFETPRWALHAHFWLERFATPHHHAWAGAFLVLEGSSLHTVYDFEEQDRISSRLRFGALKTKRIELLKAGNTVPVIPGPDYLHALWHLETPCISLSIRGRGPREELTIDYLMPGIGWEQPGPSDDHHQIFRCLDLLHRTSPEVFEAGLLNLVQLPDLYTAFLALHHACLLKGFEGLQSACEMGHEIHGTKFEPITAALAETHRTELFGRVRVNIEDPSLRFFFGALYFCQNRATVEELIRLRFPDVAPDDQIADWLDAIVEPQDLGEGPGSARDLKREMLGLLSRNRSLGALSKKIETRTGSPVNDELLRSFEKTCAEIRASLLFRPLFAV